MAKLPSKDWGDIVKALEKAGWQHDRTKGSHYIMVRSGQEALLSIPMHKPVRKGTLRSIIRVAGLTIDEFNELLD